ncbi:hypothetical protein HELRODRAFT_173746 [Helobdella robusta]|uniref:Antistasin-like domain-containing protein n=1 Tax=Helobdella robusta TaxID=6412 RepID=T1F769_HELRO|nr:hypothetical protein HELRODRAFT_173746 [Helobdella robusta]ESO03449.1 hypothetical protein HELRODRAFT_173746 [Helobdella robusta]
MGFVALVGLMCAVVFYFPAESIDVVAPCKVLDCPEKCVNGYVLDANGCVTCECNNACGEMQCGENAMCAAVDSAKPEAGFKCFPLYKLCCPRPTKPIWSFWFYPQNYCQTCFPGCKNYGCPKGQICCTDWFGCPQCVWPVICMDYMEDSMINIKQL